MRYIKSFQNDAAIQAAVDDKSLGHPYVALDDQLHRIDWNGKDVDYSKMYLTIEVLESGTFSLKNWLFSYSINGGSWVSPSGAVDFSVNTGDKIRFKAGFNPDHYVSSPLYGNTIRFNVYGNIMSIIYGDNFDGQTQYRIDCALFDRCTGLVDASGLILPATSFTNIANYKGMFNGCISLITAPDLTLGVLVKECYKWMFQNCYSLSYIKCLATNISAQDCTNFWVQNVSPTGTFVKKAGVTWPTGDSGIPSGWTVIEE